jgi:hypothetical protein
MTILDDGSTSRLWHYLNIYFLKPFDALNDTVTSSLLTQFDWPASIVEIGPGDGLFSYIMHGGSLPLSFDRYLQTDLTQSDIYDFHVPGLISDDDAPTEPVVIASVDSSFTHMVKVSELGFANNSLCSSYEHLPFPDGSLQAIFYYIPHGLIDHGLAIKEAHRVLTSTGTMILLAYDNSIRDSFLFHRIGSSLSGRYRRYFLALDNGRYTELMNLARTEDGWHHYFGKHGFSIEDVHRGLSTAAWKLYDTQTRPILKPLIKFFNMMPSLLRTSTKLVWMLAWYPILITCLLILGARDPFPYRKTCFLAFQLQRH